MEHRKTLSILLMTTLGLFLGLITVMLITYTSLRQESTDPSVVTAVTESEATIPTEIPTVCPTLTVPQTEAETDPQTESETDPPQEETESAPLPTETETTEVVEADPYLIVIDPGHQLYGDYSTEPIGPGAEEEKPRVASGTQGIVTGIPEHELTLRVSLLLKDVLEARGYEVYLIRDTNDVSISNAERAQIANELQADAFLRIHGNGDADNSVHGALTICMTPTNPYNSALYTDSRLLSDLILAELCHFTGAKNRSVWETDTMTGINWCQVPVTIVEMGFMTNEEEDRLLSDPDYQRKIAEGIAAGLDLYFARSQGDTSTPNES